MEEKREGLYIPQGIKTRVEIYDGYGKEELFITIVVTLITMVVSGLIYLLSKNVVVSVVMVLVMISASVMMLTKDINNLSVVDQVIFMVKYVKSQKVYPYEYESEWIELAKACRYEEEDKEEGAKLQDPIRKDEDHG